MTTFPHEEAVELVGALRELIATVRVVDAPIEVLSAARLLIDDARAVLDPHRYVGQVAQGALEGEGIGLRTPFVGTPNEFFPYSPIVGPLNPVAPPVRMWADDALRVHGAVTLDSDTGEICCTVCGLRFPIRDGIPVMLLDEARKS